MGGHLVVDGYNLARSGTLSLEGAPGSAEERGELCSLLSRYAREKGLRLTVVFDGRGSGNPERTRHAFKGGTALYSSRSETADDVIRDLARSVPPGTIAVTSDRGLAGTLPRRSVAIISCEEFALHLFEFHLADMKGGPEEPSSGERHPKKGEGRRPKKQERKRDRLLRKL
ncbi:MAG TPA: NYN domain-containing protein [Candidatus Limnocylindrales bacterium]|nr:NYN domain-containing protein [Candidatus Limnocylindrales bacterium]